MADGQKLRRVNLSTGQVSTIAGQNTSGTTGDGGPASAAFLDDPQGTCVMQNGVVLVCELTSNRIRQIDPASGIIST